MQLTPNLALTNNQAIASLVQQHRLGKNEPERFFIHGISTSKFLVQDS